MELVTKSTSYCGINMRDNLREVTICDFTERIYIWQIPRIKMKSFL